MYVRARCFLCWWLSRFAFSGVQRFKIYSGIFHGNVWLHTCMCCSYVLCIFIIVSSDRFATSTVVTDLLLNHFLHYTKILVVFCIAGAVWAFLYLYGFPDFIWRVGYGGYGFRAFKCNVLLRYIDVFESVSMLLPFLLTSHMYSMRSRILLLELPTYCSRHIGFPKRPWFRR